MKKETWKKIGSSKTGRRVYYVSDLGRCKSVDTVTGDERITLGYKNNRTGYLTYCGGQYVHRLVARAFLPPPEEGQTEIDHRDSIRNNNTACNLRWISVAANRRTKHKRTAQRVNHRSTRHNG